MISSFQNLNPSDLAELGKALRAGRLEPDFTPTSLQRYCSGADLSEIATELQKLSDEGVSTAHLALLFELLADERASQTNPDDLIDLVWTGPEPEGTASRDTSIVVPELFSKAKETVLVAGYAIYQGRSVFESLAQRMEKYPDLKVQMFLNVQRDYGDTTEEISLLRNFANRFKEKEWPGTRMPEAYYFPEALADTKGKKKASLHAKCIVIDRSTAFVSSANFTEAAQIRNIEVGVLINSANFATKLAQHFQAAAAQGVLKPIPGI